MSIYIFFLRVVRYYNNLPAAMISVKTRNSSTKNHQGGMGRYRDTDVCREKWKAIEELL